MHLDGARLWEAVAAGAGTLKEYCACFDSVSLCFSKGLGAPIGSVIVGSREFISRARWVRKSIGGGIRQAGIIAAAARVSVDETFLGGKLAESHRRAKEVADMWVRKGGRLQHPCETNMVWMDLDGLDDAKEMLVELGAAEGMKLMRGRLVVHYRKFFSPHFPFPPGFFPSITLPFSPSFPPPSSWADLFSLLPLRA